MADKLENNNIIMLNCNKRVIDKEGKKWLEKSVPCVQKKN